MYCLAEEGCVEMRDLYVVRDCESELTERRASERKENIVVRITLSSRVTILYKLIMFFQ